MNANRKLRALSTFARWQVATRLLNGKVVVPWVGDSRLIVGLGDTGLTGNLYTGLVDYEEMLFLLHALRSTETFVDVGANLGAYTILASKVIHAQSIAFEPVPETAQRLRDQVQINRIQSTVDIRNIGVGDKSGTLQFTNDRDTMNKVSLTGQGSHTTAVAVGTLDAELPEGGQYFLKIDVEGFEYNVIEGASRTLSTQSVSAMILELNGSGAGFGHTDEETHQELLAFDFKPVAYDPLKRSLRRLSSYNQGGGNTIYVKDIELMAERCRCAPTRIVHTAGGIAM
jgi:FkbM family methyltransferase